MLRRKNNDITYDKGPYGKKPISLKPFIFIIVLAIIGMCGYSVFRHYEYLLDDRQEANVFNSHLAESASDAYPVIIEFGLMQSRFNEIASRAGLDYELKGSQKTSRDRYEVHSKFLSDSTAIYFTTASGSYDVKKIAILSSSKDQQSQEVLKSVLGVIMRAIDSELTEEDVEKAQLQVFDVSRGNTSFTINDIKYSYINSSKLYWIEINR